MAERKTSLETKETACDHIIYTSHEFYSTIIYGWEKDFSGEKGTACDLAERRSQIVQIIYTQCAICANHIFVNNLCTFYINHVSIFAHYVHNLCTFHIHNVKFAQLTYLWAICAHYIDIMCNLCTLYKNYVLFLHIMWAHST